MIKEEIIDLEMIEALEEAEEHKEEVTQTIGQCKEIDQKDASIVMKQVILLEIVQLLKKIDLLIKVIREDMEDRVEEIARDQDQEVIVKKKEDKAVLLGIQ